jgi:alanyl-tRNA synthetase
MGLERIGALLQGKHDNYDTDLMRALIEASADATGVDPDGPGNVHHRVIADHLRSTSLPDRRRRAAVQRGRGYVLRRIMRRAMRHAHLLGAQDPLMHRLVPALVREMGAGLSGAGRAQALITETLKLEETRFRKTLDRGLKLLDEEAPACPRGDRFPARTAFKLYDTYGFPLDLTQDALRARNRGRHRGFDAAMAEQKAEARAAWSGSGEAADAAIWFDLPSKPARPISSATTPRRPRADQALLALVAEVRAATAKAGEAVSIVVNQTPFYGESGGQVGDTGHDEDRDGYRATVTDTQEARRACSCTWAR